MQANRGLRRGFRRGASCIGRRVLDRFITYVGLEVHKETIAVALAEAGRGDDVREYGKIANTPTSYAARVSHQCARRGGRKKRGRCIWRNRKTIVPELPPVCGNQPFAG